MNKRIRYLLGLNLLLPAILLTYAAGTGCGISREAKLNREKAEKIMNYTSAEWAELDEYLRHSVGAMFYYYKNSGSAREVFSCKVADMDEIPEREEIANGGYIKVSAYIAFSEDGNQHISLDGPDNALITVTYNELHTESYTSETFFKANAFYKLNISYSYREGLRPEFRTDSAYRISSQLPSFGGIPSAGPEPVADIHLRDPFIMSGHDGRYYMTGTYDPADWANTKEIHVYRSDDLENWEDLGAVWNYEKDATWQKELIADGPSPIWAPELHYIRGNYYICYSLGWGSMSGAVLRSSTGLPEGPYEDICSGPVFDYIDSSFFVDDDGTVYALWSDGLLAEMNRDMNGLKGSVTALKSESGMQVGFEGCYLFKIGGLYYLCSSTYAIHYREDGSEYQTYDSFYAVSDRLKGPYSERRLLLEGGGHNSLFYSANGTLYTTAFYGSDFSERPAVVPLSVTPEGLLKVE